MSIILFLAARRCSECATRRGQLKAARISGRNAVRISGARTDAGGSNSYRARLWKYQLQKLADETGRRITVSHFPPGTSKWNKIEHRMFCHITANWRGSQ